MLENVSRNRRRLVWLLLAVFSSGSYAYACLQGEELGVQPVKRVRVEGVSASDFAKDFVTHEDRAYWERVRAVNEKLGKAKTSALERNGLAVALVHLGRIGEAVPILEEIERKGPGEYVTAANLGTAYELTGDNRKALEWIKEGVRRNADSHYGTEWLHVKILEAKLALENDPAWLSKNTVLGAGVSAPEAVDQPSKPVTDHEGRPKSLAEVESALVYQLHERMEFVRPPDPVVADLLLALSNVLERTRGPEYGQVARGLAFDYGADQQALERSRRPAGRQIEKFERPASSLVERFYRLFAAPTIAALLLAGVLYVLLRRRGLR